MSDSILLSSGENVRERYLIGGQTERRRRSEARGCGANFHVVCASEKRLIFLHGGTVCACVCLWQRLLQLLPKVSKDVVHQKTLQTTKWRLKAIAFRCPTVSLDRSLTQV